MGREAGLLALNSCIDCGAEVKLHHSFNGESLQIQKLLSI